MCFGAILPIISFTRQGNMHCADSLPANCGALKRVDSNWIENIVLLWVEITRSSRECMDPLLSHSQS